MKIHRNIYIFILLLIPGSSFGQPANKSKIDFIKVYETKSYRVVPFPRIETEISNYQLCFRNILPPRQKMSKEHLECYDKWDLEPKYYQMTKIDFDSIVNFIMTSGLLNIDLNYTKIDTTAELIRMNIGGGSKSYVVETTKGRLTLLVSGAQVFNLPVILKEFDDLFIRITNRYKTNNEIKPAI